MPTMSRMMLVPLLATCAARADVLWDNGFSDLDGLGNGSGDGVHRSILDEFVVDAPDGWSLTGVEVVLWWGLHSKAGIGADLEVVFYGDVEGRPDFEEVVAVAANREYSETNRKPCQFLGCSVDAVVTFDAVELPPGRYWAEFHVVSGREERPRAWQFLADGVSGSAIWVDYEDFGGRQPGRDVFGVDYDVNFRLTGTVASACPADLDGSGAVDIGDILAILAAWGDKGGPEDVDGSGTVDFGDILAVLTAWGPCE